MKTQAPPVSPRDYVKLAAVNFEKNKEAGVRTKRIERNGATALKEDLKPLSPATHDGIIENFQRARTGSSCIGCFKQ